jgi:hypothetical protein
MAAKLDGHLPRTSGGDDDVNMSPNAGMSDPTADDIVPFRRRRQRQLRTGLQDHVTVVTADGERTLVPMDTTQTTLGAVRVLAVQVEGETGTQENPIIL